MPAQTVGLLALIVHFSSPTGAEEKAVLLEACTKALAAEACVQFDPKSQPESETSPSSGRDEAWIERTDDELVAVELRTQRGTEVHRTSREVRFQPEDAPLDRARSLGLNLGVLSKLSRLNLETSAPDAASVEEDAGEETPQDDRAGDAPNEPPASLWTLGVALGGEFDPSLLAFGLGADMHGAYFPWSQWGGLLRASGFYLPSGSLRPDMALVTPSAGLIWRTSSLGTEFRVEAEIGAELIRARLNPEQQPDASTGVASRWVSSSRLGANLLVHFSEHTSLSINPALSLLFSRTDLYVDDTLVGTTAPLRFGLRFGLVFRGH